MPAAWTRRHLRDADGPGCDASALDGGIAGFSHDQGADHETGSGRGQEGDDLGDLGRLRDAAGWVHVVVVGERGAASTTPVSLRMSASPTPSATALARMPQRPYSVAISFKGWLIAPSTCFGERSERRWAQGSRRKALKV